VEWEGRARQRDVLSGKLGHSREVQKLGRWRSRPINKENTMQFVLYLLLILVENKFFQCY
jgi:hypothetical protein